MVDQSSNFVARKYAHAALAILGKQFDSEQMHNLDRMSAFLVSQHSLIYLLGLSIVTPEKKRIIMHGMAKKYQLEVLEPLIDLLLAHKRLFLLADILRLMSQFYREQKGILVFKISSYPRLESNEREELQQFLARGTGCAIIYTDYEDKNLIAGIRMESTTYLWEYSIAQQLQNVRKRTMR